MIWRVIRTARQSKSFKSTRRRHRMSSRTMKLADYPKPTIPLTPLLDFPLWDKIDHSSTDSVLDCRHIRYTTSGRGSLVLALEQCGISSDDEVLLPAFHCESMVAPVRFLKACPVFYRITSNTSLDIEDLQSKISHRTKVIIVTHYFGFPQNLDSVRLVCDQNQLSLIEDCAHSFFGKSGNSPVGQIGDYAIASSMKFFPVYDGGILASNHNNLNHIELFSPSAIFQAKSLINMLENAVHYNRLGSLGAIARFGLSIKTLTWSIYKKFRRISSNKRIGPTSSDGGFGLDKEWIYKESSFISSKVIQSSNFHTIAITRRQNYLKLESALKNLPGCHSLFEQLPESAVPLVYPLYVDQAKKVFPELKWAGIPIWRFGEYLDPDIDQSVCPISVEYSEHIFQFPCHQSLTAEEIDWMISQIQYTMSNS